MPYWLTDSFLHPHSFIRLYATRPSDSDLLIVYHAVLWALPDLSVRADLGKTGSLSASIAGPVPHKP